MTGEHPQPGYLLVSWELTREVRAAIPIPSGEDRAAAARAALAAAIELPMSPNPAAVHQLEAHQGTYIAVRPTRRRFRLHPGVLEDAIATVWGDNAVAMGIGDVMAAVDFDNPEAVSDGLLESMGYVVVDCLVDDQHGPVCGAQVEHHRTEAVHTCSEVPGHRHGEHHCHCGRTWRG